MRTQLKLKVLGKYGSITNFAKALGCTRQTASSMLKDANLSQTQILQICELLGIKRKDILDYFFPVDVKIVKRSRTNV